MFLVLLPGHFHEVITNAQTDAHTDMHRLTKIDTSINTATYSLI